MSADPSGGFPLGVKLVKVMRGVARPYDLHASKIALFHSRQKSTRRAYEAKYATSIGLARLKRREAAGISHPIADVPLRRTK